MLTGSLSRLVLRKSGVTPTTSTSVVVAVQLAADRILRAPQALRQAGGNDGDLSIAVLLFEIAPVAQTDAEGLEISGTDEAHVGGGQFHHGPCVVFRADDVDPGFAHQRQGRYERGALHAGHGGSLFEHALEEGGRVRAAWGIWWKAARRFMASTRST